MNYEIPLHLQGPLQAIAQTTGLSLEAVMEEAIALYINRRAPLPPSMSAGLNYEDIENEPDEILSDFIDTGSSRPWPATIPSSTDPGFSVTKRPLPYGAEDDDEPYEILPGFLEP